MKIPETVKEAVDQLILMFNQEDLDAIKKFKPKKQITKVMMGDKTIINEYMTELPYHFSSGMNMRNDWQLWEKDTPLKKDFINTYKIAHGDDCSGLIFSWAFAIIRGQVFDPQKECERYHKHWANYGETSLSAASIK